VFCFEVGQEFGIEFAIVHDPFPSVFFVDIYNISHGSPPRSDNSSILYLKGAFWQGAALPH
jgi:hypothetical protein